MPRARCAALRALLDTVVRVEEGVRHSGVEHFGPTSIVHDRDTPLLHLDQFHWVGLAKAAAGSSTPPIAGFWRYLKPSPQLRCWWSRCHRRTTWSRVGSRLTASAVPDGLVAAVLERENLSFVHVPKLMCDAEPVLFGGDHLTSCSPVPTLVGDDDVALVRTVGNRQC